MSLTETKNYKNMREKANKKKLIGVTYKQKNWPIPLVDQRNPGPRVTKIYFWQLDKSRFATESIIYYIWLVELTAIRLPSNTLYKVIYWWNLKRTKIMVF